jgi:4-amino-4-deoxy-L-arabinose transferase-like glycosyltransferase
MAQKKFILGVLLLATLLRFVVFVVYEPWSEDWQSRYLGADPASYWMIAHNILNHGAISLSVSEPYLPDSQRPPVYPLFLASIVAFFGSRAWPICIVQSLLGVAIVYVLYRTAQLVIEEGAARIVAAFAAIDFYMIEFGCLLWSDFLFVAILTISLLVVAAVLRSDAEQRSPNWLWLALGGLIGLAVLTRPVAQYLLLIVLSLIVGLRATKCAFTPLRIVALVMLVIGWSIVTVPWLCRNYHAFGSFGFSSIKGANLLFFEGAEVVARTKGITYHEAKQELASAHWRAYDGKNNFECDSYYTSEAVKIFKAHPIDAIIVHMQGMLRTFRRVDGILWKESSGPGGDYRSYMHSLKEGGPAGLWRYMRNEARTIDASFFILHLGFLVLLYLGVILSVVSYRHLSSRTKMMFCYLIIWMLYFNFLSAVPGGLRYRLPLHPAMELLAGFGYWHYYTILCRQRRARATPITS